MSESSNDPGRVGPLPLVVGARNGGIAVAAILAAVGALFAWQASLLDLGHVGLPGPGFFPLVLAITVILSSIIIGIEHCRSTASSKKAGGEAAGGEIAGGEIAGGEAADVEAVGSEKVEFFHRDMVIVMAASLTVPLVFNSLGALLTLAVFVVAILVIVARVSLWLAVVAAAAFVGACWVMFEVLLGLQLPTGPF